MRGCYFTEARSFFLSHFSFLSFSPILLKSGDLNRDTFNTILSDKKKKYLQKYGYEKVETIPKYFRQVHADS